MDEKTNEKFKEFYDSLTDEQKEKVRNCKTEEEFIAFAEEEDIELPEELVESVAGGWSWALQLPFAGKPTPMPFR